MAVDSGKRNIANVFSIILAICVGGLFIVYKDEVASTLKEIDFVWVGLSLVCFFTNYLFRAIRIHVLMKKKIKVFPDGLYCSSLHGFTTYMLPVRTGELSLPFILKTITQIDIKDGFKILYKARLLDILVLGIWLILASLIPYSVLPKTYHFAMLVLGVLMVLTPMIIRALSNRALIHSQRMRNLAKAISEYSSPNKNEFLLSIIIWSASAAMLWCITSSINIHLSINELLFLIAFQLVMQFLPIQGFANSGNHESGWIAAMVMIGYPTDASLKFALASHTVIIAFMLILGLLAIILRSFTKNEPAPL